MVLTLLKSRTLSKPPGRYLSRDWMVPLINNMIQRCFYPSEEG